MKHCSRRGLVLTRTAATTLAAILCIGRPAHAQDQDRPPSVTYGSRGLELRAGGFAMQISARLQFRAFYPLNSDVDDPSDLTALDEYAFRVNRARLKIGGHGYRPWLKYYFEYDLPSNSLLDFRAMVERWPALNLKVGQWKAEYSRERIISSGSQQLADRSLINSAFTIDRQQGVSLSGHLAGGGPADVSYWASVFTGTGRGASGNDDRTMMWMGRVQWNVFGRVLAFEGSDVDRREKPEGSIAFAATTNRSPYTRFSTSGGGQLRGFASGVPGQYRVTQWLGETAFMYRGLAWQQEFHWKRITDSVTTAQTTMRGAYFQLGYFLHEAIPAVPAPLEIAARYAFLDPNTDAPDDLVHEYSIAANWFFAGHKNKLTAEASHFTLDEPAPEQSGWRYRLQWDVSF